MTRFTNIALSFLCAGLVACVSEQVPNPGATRGAVPRAVHNPALQQDTGEDVARHLTDRYSKTAADCGGPGEPAFLCNGVMIRGTSENPTYHVWENSAASLAKGGVSVSYLRSDSNYNKLAYGYSNGFILTAYYYAAAKLQPEVLCVFPIDAGTANRGSKGCGEYPNYPGSGPCHLKGVTTASLWWADYNAHSSSRHNYQCGFDVSDARDGAAGPAFAAALGAMALMGAESFKEQNELILAAWGNGLGKTLPLEAFFYVAGLSGLASAQRNQSDLLDTDGVWIPVIKLTLPASQSGKATFTYSAADQASVPVGGSGGCNSTDLANERTKNDAARITSRLQKPNNHAAAAVGSESILPSSVGESASESILVEGFEDVRVGKFSRIYTPQSTEVFVPLIEDEEAISASGGNVGLTGNILTVHRVIQVRPSRPAKGISFQARPLQSGGLQGEITYVDSASNILYSTTLGSGLCQYSSDVPIRNVTIYPSAEVALDDFTFTY
jgi:hypothetical protein